MRLVPVAGAVLALISFLTLPSLRTKAAEGAYSLKSVDAPPPKELKEPIRNLIGHQALQVLDANGNVFCEVWLRKSLPAKATPEQISNGLTYRDLEETTLLGAVRFAQAGSDYRMQPVDAGVYTLRLGFQPMDGDHLGTALYSEFCLVVSAGKDPQPAPMDAMKLQSLSAESLNTSHPGVVLLFPNNKPDAAPLLADQGMGHWVLKASIPVDAKGKPAKIGIGLVVIGHSPAA